jgi:hypothetical protein
MRSFSQCKQPLFAWFNSNYGSSLIIRELLSRERVRDWQD